MPDKKLGQGEFGQVIAGRFRGSLVAVKVTKSGANSLIHAVSQDEEKAVQHLGLVANEIRLMRHVRHPNIVLFHGACVDPRVSEIALVFEMIEGITLDKAVPREPVADDAAVLHQVCVQMCCALHYLHSHSPVIVHSDLKASNVMVEHWPQQVRTKLLDFGLSLIVNKRSKLSGGTRSWMPPEMFSSTSMSPLPSVDVFSFGRLMHMVLAGIRPPSERICEEEGELSWPASAPFRDLGTALCTTCLQTDPTLRPPIAVIQEELLSWKPNLDIGPNNKCYMSFLRLKGCSWQEGISSFRNQAHCMEHDTKQRLPEGAGIVAPLPSEQSLVTGSTYLTL